MKRGHFTNSNIRISGPSGFTALALLQAYIRICEAPLFHTRPSWTTPVLSP